MTTFPLYLVDIFGQYGAYLVFLVIGFFFGYALEIAGFAHSPKLAAQFYFKDMTVLKVMFTAIVVAMVGIFLASGLGLLDYNLIWVNPTYLWPGILGGLIMGFGFILGGFCPGTSLAAVATGKIDGIFFALGVLFGIFSFGETVDLFASFFHSSYMGRFTLQNWLGLDTGIVVLIVVLMALFMFWGGEKLEAHFGQVNQKKAPKMRYVGAGALVILAVAVLFIGQPTTADKWAMIAAEKETLLVEERAYQIHPGELLSLMHDEKLKLIMLDVRAEADYNLFHIVDAKNISLQKLPELIPDYLLEPYNTVFVLISNHEDVATEAWKMMVAESVHNVYILEGGINFWLDTFTSPEQSNVVLTMHSGEDDLHHDFESAIGELHSAADPDPDLFELEYTPKVKLEIKRGPVGSGCG